MENSVCLYVALDQISAWFQEERCLYRRAGWTTMTLEYMNRMGEARDKLKAAQEKVAEITSNPHRSLMTRALHDAVEVYNEAVAEVIDILRDK